MATSSYYSSSGTVEDGYYHASVTTNASTTYTQNFGERLLSDFRNQHILPYRTSQFYSIFSDEVVLKGRQEQMIAVPEPLYHYATTSSSTDCTYPRTVDYQKIEAQWTILVKRHHHNHKLSKPISKEKSPNAIAKDLFTSLLTQQELNEYENSGFITVFVEDRILQIHKGKIKNIIEVDKDGKQLHKWCLHGSDPGLPVYDHMVMQMVLLQSQPKEFFAIANKWDN